MAGSESDDGNTKMFLTDDELAELTGRKLRRLQIEALKLMMIPFRVNAIGRPIVTREAVLGQPAFGIGQIDAAIFCFGVSPQNQFHFLSFSKARIWLVKQRVAALRFRDIARC